MAGSVLQLSALALILEKDLKDAKGKASVLIAQGFSPDLRLGL